MVTGAAQGIGLGIARSLAGAGFRVALGDVLADQVLHAATTIAEGCSRETLGLALDVTQAEDWNKFIGRVRETWGRLDLLVNYAGISPRGTVESTDEALWDRTLKINLKGAWLGIKAALPCFANVAGRSSTSARPAQPGRCPGFSPTS